MWLVDIKWFSFFPGINIIIWPSLTYLIWFGYFQKHVLLLRLHCMLCKIYLEKRRRWQMRTTIFYFTIYMRMRSEKLSNRKCCDIFKSGIAIIFDQSRSQSIRFSARDLVWWKNKGQRKKFAIRTYIWKVRNPVTSSDLGKTSLYLASTRLWQASCKMYT